MNRPLKIILIILLVLAGLCLLAGGLLTLILGDRAQEEIENVSRPNSLPRYYYQIDTSTVVLPDSYYQFIRVTDSTSAIRWGKISRAPVFSDTIDNFFVEKDKINLKWSNEKFIALGRSSGSDTWFTIVLPLEKGASAQLYENLLAADKENGIIVCEPSFNNSDTVLIAENILTGKRQIIGMDWKKYSSAFNHYCIDSISLSKKLLYVEWTLPNKIDAPNQKEIKRIQLDL